MRPRQVLLALGLSCLINAGSLTLASADDRPSPVPQPEAKQAREKFAKLLLPDGARKKSEKLAAKRRGVVVNAFGHTVVIIH